MRLDFSEVKESKIAAEGTHTLTIFKAVEKKSQNGTQMLVLDMRDEEEGYCRDHICLEGPAAFRAKQLFEALGIDDDEAKSMEASNLVGMSVEADIIIESYEGEDRAKVKKYIA